MEVIDLLEILIFSYAFLFIFKLFPNFKKLPFDAVIFLLQTSLMGKNPNEEFFLCMKVISIIYIEKKVEPTKYPIKKWSKLVTPLTRILFNQKTSIYGKCLKI